MPPTLTDLRLRQQKNDFKYNPSTIIANAVLAIVTDNFDHLGFAISALIANSPSQAAP